MVGVNTIPDRTCSFCPAANALLKEGEKNGPMDRPLRKKFYPESYLGVAVVVLGAVLFLVAFLVAFFPCACLCLVVVGVVVVLVVSPPWLAWAKARLAPSNMVHTTVNSFFIAVSY
jgi:hypothetical protein